MNKLPNLSGKVIAVTQAALGPIDVLVNNAGLMWVGPFVDESESAAARQVAVNLLGVIRGVKLTAPIMLARGRGHIITIASAASGTATGAAIGQRGPVRLCGPVRFQSRVQPRYPRIKRCNLNWASMR